MGFHRAPWQCTYVKEDKNKCLRGKKPKSDQEYFEILCLLILQAGLNWGTIRKNWQKYKKGFHNFNINKLTKAKVSDLMQNKNVIKNSKKIASIIYDAKEFLRIKTEYGSFYNFLCSSKGMKTKERYKLLMERFKHVGPYIAEFYLYCVGY